MKEQNLSPAYTKELKSEIRALGADLVGVADVEPLKELKVDPQSLLSPFSRAVSIALQLPAAVFEEIRDRPTPVYKAIYQTANLMLDQIAFRAAMILEKDGHYSLPIPASQVLDRKNWYGAISHKAVARVAGLGWQGKNLLLITPRYGSRVRLATVLTKARLEIDGPVKNRCGKCTNCMDACPAQAIKGVNTMTHYKSREEALYFERCRDKVVEEFAEIPDVGVPICGLCIRVCPFGRKMRTKEEVTVHGFRG
ncbi:MAG: epoxyqueuosine reductase [Deltaproteobacteria bacterium]|nr:epoxyqueuosine reductase [Deltaproteobacteria bacterium]